MDYFKRYCCNFERITKSLKVLKYVTMKCHDWIALEVFPCNTGGLEKLFPNITSHQSINKIRATPIKSGKWRKQR